MGREAKTYLSLADALFTPVQQRVLTLLFAQPERSFQSAELIRLVGSGTGATHRVLSRLTETGLVGAQRVGNQKHYRANPDSPIFQELRGLVIKTMAVVEPVRRVLAPLSDQISAAFVYGSIAKGEESVHSDIDLLVLTDTLTYPDLIELLQEAEDLLGRPVNPTLMGVAEWQAKRREPDSFARRVAAGPKLMIMGSEDELE